jgi:anthranilate synthase/aminodeoxychorismate synthase-like glutamine amidotransferase
VRLLFVENHDSFSANLLAVLPVPPEAVRVVHAPQALEALADADALVIGPGPTDPLRAGLLEVVRAAAERRLPTLGVCLGHQALGVAFGAALVRTPPAHGTPARVRFEPSRSFPGIEGELMAMRYHSLSLADVVAPLRVVARLEDGTVMAVEHQALPMAGLQFHPDSYATPRGREVLAAFFARHLPAAVAPPGTSAPRRVQVTELSAHQDFALLGPGFDDTGAWTLFTSVREGPGELVLAEAEARQPRFFSGRREPVEVAIDAAPLALSPRVDEARFAQGVELVREAVARGDVYQVNLTQRVALGEVDGARLLATLCRRAVPRFAAWLKLRGVGEVVSASPELLVELSGRAVRAEPMKGTAPAGERARLEASSKDAAELAMITDLVRDDLQPLCEAGTVRVPHPRRFLELPYAVQAVADVEGLLRPGLGVSDVLARLHPGGSVTGAPRQAALQFIAHLETSPRGPYCGTLGLGTGGRWRCALLIRTAFRRAPGWQLGVGNGITYASRAQAELDELQVKLGMLEGSPYTALRVTAAGVLLFDEHRARLGLAARAAFDAFAASAAPGVYALTWTGGALEVKPRPSSRLFDGMAVRYLPSPLAPGLGPLPKAPSPGPYDALRAPGLATLLTDAEGSELWESCTAAVLAWDGAGLVAPPEDRSRVASTAERALQERLPVRRAPVRVDSGWPLLLVNAVAPVCVPAGSAFPAEARQAVEAALEATTRRGPG